MPTFSTFFINCEQKLVKVGKVKILENSIDFQNLIIFDVAPKLMNQLMNPKLLHQPFGNHCSIQRSKKYK
jgi:hypothetical protein